MGELRWGMSMDSKGFKQGLDEAVKGVRSAKNEIESSGQSMAHAFDGLKSAMKGLGLALGLNELKNLGIKIAQTRGEFQQLEVAFKTMLGSGERANALMSQLTKTAATTPFGLQEVASGAKQLLAYGIEAEKVNDMLIRLGDIASGLSIPLNDLVYLYGTTMTQGRMFTQDLRQFQGRGIPIADELAKQFGIAKSQVGEFVTAGKVGAKEVEQAIINMTSEGSKFGGLMEAQSKTIVGQWSNIQDQIDMLFNSIGQDSEGAINQFLKSVGDSIEFLAENYKTIGVSIAGVIASYGVWKATLVGHNALLEAQTLGEQKRIQVVTDAYQAEIDKLKELNALKEGGQVKAVSVDTSDIKQAVDTGAISQDQADELVHLRELTAEKKLLAEAELVNASALVKEKQAVLEQASALAEAALEQQEFYQSKLEGLDEQISMAESAGDAEEALRLSTERNVVATQLEASATKANAQGTKVATASKELDIAVARQHVAVKNLNTATENANTAATMRNTSAQVTNTTAQKTDTIATRVATMAKGALSFAISKVSLAFKALGTAIMSNPIGFLLTAITSAISIYSTWKTKQEELNKSMEEGKQMAKDYFDAIAQEGSTIKSHVNTIRDKNADTLEQVKAYSKLIELVPELTKQYSQQQIAAWSTAEAEEKLTKAINDREIAKTEEAGTRAKNVIEKQQSGAKWEDLAPEDRKFLEDDMKIDKDFYNDNYEKMILQLKEVANESQKATNHLQQMHRIAELQGMEKGAEKTKALNNELNTLSNKQKELAKLQKLADTSSTWANYGNRAQLKLNDQYGSQANNPKYQAQYEQYKKDFEQEAIKNKEEMIAIAQKYGISIDELISLQLNNQRYVPQNFNFLLSGIKDKIEPVKTQILEEIKSVKDIADYEGATDIELNPYLKLNEKQLKDELVKVEDNINDVLRQGEKAFSEEELIKTVEANLDVKTERGQAALASAMYLLDMKAQELGKPRYVFADVNLEAKVNTIYRENPLATNLTNIPTSVLQSGTSGWGTTTSKNGTSVDYQIEYAREVVKRKRLEKQLENLQKNRTAPASSGKSGKSGKGTSGSSGKSKAELQREVDEATLEYNEVLNEVADERKEFTLDLTNELTQLEINVEKDAHKKRLKQIEQDRKIELEEIKKRREDAIEDEKDRRKREFEAKEKKTKAEQAQKGKKYTEKLFTDDVLKEDKEYQQAVANINATFDKLEKAVTESSDFELKKEKQDKMLQSEYDYLTQYGTLLQKELAITEKYNKLIDEARKSGDTYQEKTLIKQRDSEIAKVQSEEMKKGVDWTLIFGDVSNYSTDILEQTRLKILELIRTQKQMETSDIKALLEQYQKMGDAIEANKFDLLELWGIENKRKKTIEALTRNLNDAKKVQEEFVKKETEATQKRDDAYGEFSKLFQEATGKEITLKTTQELSREDLNKQLTERGVGEDKATEIINSFSKFGETSSALADASANVAEAGSAVAGAEGALSGASGAGGSGAGFAIADAIIHGVNQNLQSLSTFVDDLGLGDTEAGKGIKDFAESSQYATQAFESFKQGDFFGVLMNLNKAFGKLGDVLGRMGIAGMGASDINLHDDLERMSRENEALTNAISKLTEVIEEGSFAEAIDAYGKSLEQTKESEANTRESMQRSAKAYNNGFLGIGGDRSSAHEINEEITSKEWDRVSKIVGHSVRGASDFFNLTSEQMAMVARDAPDIYARIKHYASQGYEDASAYMDEYIAYYENLDELHEQFVDKLTATSLDELKSTFGDFIADSEKEVYDFGSTFEEVMVNAIKESLMAGVVGEELRKFQEKWAEYTQSGGGLDANEVAELRQDWNDIATMGRNLYESQLEALGINPDYKESSSASNRGVETMTQEEASEMNGRLTALQIAGEAIRSESVRTNELVESLISQIAPSIATSAESSNTLYELRELALARNIFLSDISDYTKNLIAIKNTLTQIENNTQNL